MTCAAATSVPALAGAAVSSRIARRPPTRVRAALIRVRASDSESSPSSSSSTSSSPSPSFSPSTADEGEDVQAGVSSEPFSLGLRRDAEEALVLGEPLGRGAMGVVRACTRKSDGRRFALKTIPKAGPASLAGQHPTAGAYTRSLQSST
jgi:calcium-dependent protein kinase